MSYVHCCVLSEIWYPGPVLLQCLCFVCFFSLSHNIFISCGIFLCIDEPLFSSTNCNQAVNLTLTHTHSLRIWEDEVWDGGIDVWQEESQRDGKWILNPHKFDNGKAFLYDRKTELFHNCLKTMVKQRSMELCMSTTTIVRLFRLLSRLLVILSTFLLYCRTSSLTQTFPARPTSAVLHLKISSPNKGLNPSVCESIHIAVREF